MLNVLLVDDDATLRSALAMSLESVSGVTVRQAASHDEALGLARASAPDLVLMDIDLGADNGYEVIGSLRDEFPSREIEVWMVTGKSRVINESLAERLGAAGTITKPFGRSEIQKIVRAVRDRHLER